MLNSICFSYLGNFKEINNNNNKKEPGVQELQTLVVTAASDTEPGSQTTFLH